MLNLKGKIGLIVFYILNEWGESTRIEVWGWGGGEAHQGKQEEIPLGGFDRVKGVQLRSRWLSGVRKIEIVH